MSDIVEFPRTTEISSGSSGHVLAAENAAIPENMPAIDSRTLEQRASDDLDEIKLVDRAGNLAIRAEQQKKLDEEHRKKAEVASAVAAEIAPQIDAAVVAKKAEIDAKFADDLATAQRVVDLHQNRVFTDNLSEDPQELIAGRKELAKIKRKIEKETAKIDQAAETLKESPRFISDEKTRLDARIAQVDRDRADRQYQVDQLDEKYKVAYNSSNLEMTPEVVAAKKAAEAAAKKSQSQFVRDVQVASEPYTQARMTVDKAAKVLGIQSEVRATTIQQRLEAKTEELQSQQVTEPTQVVVDQAALQESDIDAAWQAVNATGELMHDLQSAKPEAVDPKDPLAAAYALSEKIKSGDLEYRVPDDEINEHVITSSPDGQISIDGVDIGDAGSIFDENGQLRPGNKNIPTGLESSIETYRQAMLIAAGQPLDSEEAGAALAAEGLVDTADDRFVESLLQDLSKLGEISGEQYDYLVNSSTLTSEQEALIAQAYDALNPAAKDALNLRRAEFLAEARPTSTPDFAQGGGVEPSTAVLSVPEHLDPVVPEKPKGFFARTLETLKGYRDNPAKVFSDASRGLAFAARSWFNGIMPVDFYRGQGLGRDVLVGRNLAEKVVDYRNRWQLRNVVGYFLGVPLGVPLEIASSVFPPIKYVSDGIRAAFALAVPYALGRTEQQAIRQIQESTELNPDDKMTRIFERKMTYTKANAFIQSMLHGVAAGAIVSSLIRPIVGVVRPESGATQSGSGSEKPGNGAGGTGSGGSGGQAGGYGEGPTPHLPEAPFGAEPVSSADKVFRVVNNRGFWGTDLSSLGDAAKNWGISASQGADKADIIGFALRANAGKFGAVGEQIAYSQLGENTRKLIDLLGKSATQADFLKNGGTTLINLINKGNL